MHGRHLTIHKMDRCYETTLHRLEKLGQYLQWRVIGRKRLRNKLRPQRWSSNSYREYLSKTTSLRWRRFNLHFYSKKWLIRNCDDEKRSRKSLNKLNIISRCLLYNAHPLKSIHAERQTVCVPLLLSQIMVTPKASSWRHGWCIPAIELYKKNM